MVLETLQTFRVMHTGGMITCDGELKLKKEEMYVPETLCNKMHFNSLVQVKYIYRRVPYSSNTGPAGINLQDGDEICFGGGTNGERLGRGPIPLLCNVQLAVARVLHMSGAAEVIMQLKQDSDDSDTPHACVTSDYFLDILDAKLLLQSIHV